MPEDLCFKELNFIFTIGFGQTFGYAYKNGMHFDFLQLIRDKSMDEFYSTLAHEVHHIGFGIIMNKIDMSKLSIEELFLFNFSAEGLAVKYCNNAQGVISNHIYESEINIGLDKFTWEYLNNDINNSFIRFKQVISNIRSGIIKTEEDLEHELKDYWMNPYINKDKENGIPELKQLRLYSFGNDIWGVIHDCFGKETVYDVLKHPEKFIPVYNSAVIKIGRSDLII